MDLKLISVLMLSAGLVACGGGSSSSDGTSDNGDIISDSNDGSTGSGDGSTGSGDGSAGSGDGSTGSGDGSTGSGDGSTGSGDGSTGSGDGSTGSGDGSTGSGDGSTGSGDGSTGSGDGSTGSGDGSAGSGDGSAETFSVFTDSNWNATDKLEDLTFMQGGTDILALKVTQPDFFTYDYTNLTATTTAKELTTHEAFTVDTHFEYSDTDFTQARTSGLKFYSSTTNSNEVLVVTCKPGKYKFPDNSSGISGFLEPATLSFSLKSNPDDVVTVDLDVPGETSDYKNIVSCDAMDINDTLGIPTSVEIFIAGRQAYLAANAFGLQSPEWRSGVSRLTIDLDIDGELIDNDPSVGPMLDMSSFTGTTIDYTESISAQYQALSMVGSSEALFYMRIGSKNRLVHYDPSVNPATTILINGNINAFNGETEGMEISDMEAHTTSGNINRVSLVSHDHTGVVTVDYDSSSLLFTKSTDEDALNCQDAITSNGQPNATLWCHDSTNKGKLIEFSY